MPDALDMFGEPLRPPSKRKARVMPDRAHAATPGTGPEGESCGTCVHLARRRSPAGSLFRKCGLMRKQWTAGYGTDVRCKDAACGLWEKVKE